MIIGIKPNRLSINYFRVGVKMSIGWLHQHPSRQIRTNSQSKNVFALYVNTSCSCDDSVLALHYRYNHTTPIRCLKQGQDFGPSGTMGKEAYLRNRLQFLPILFCQGDF